MMDRTEWKIHAMIDINACNTHTHTHTYLWISAALRHRMLCSSSILFRLWKSLQEVGRHEAFVSIEIPLKTTKTHHALLLCSVIQLCVFMVVHWVLEIQRSKTEQFWDIYLLPRSTYVHLTTLLSHNNSFKNSLFPKVNKRNSIWVWNDKIWIVNNNKTKYF